MTSSQRRDFAIASFVDSSLIVGGILVSLAPPPPWARLYCAALFILAGLLRLSLTMRDRVEIEHGRKLSAWRYKRRREFLIVQAHRLAYHVSRWFTERLAAHPEATNNAVPEPELETAIRLFDETAVRQFREAFDIEATNLLAALSLQTPFGEDLHRAFQKLRLSPCDVVCVNYFLRSINGAIGTLCEDEYAAMAEYDTFLEESKEFLSGPSPKSARLI